MRRLAHTLARRVLGRAYPRALRRWRGAQGAWRSRRLARGTERFVDWHGLTVSGGPFAGLRYPGLGPHSLAPKLIGAYERELHGAIENAIRAQPATIVNVGAADGYYAVGLARRCPGARVVAYEADARERAVLAQVAAANAVGLEIKGAAGREDLARDIAGAGRRESLAAAAPDDLAAALLVVDCEGCERELLARGETAWLAGATVIVELHDVYDPGVGDAIVERFAATHDVVITPTGPQPPANRLLSEQRPGPMRWAVMTPRREPRG
jgi:hypothetical protein